jgi:hypothetical protein
MNKKTLYLIIVLFCIAIVGLLIVLVLTRNNVMTNSTTTTNKQHPNQVQQQGNGRLYLTSNLPQGPNFIIQEPPPPLVAGSPYFYDTGYWLDPWNWWSSRSTNYNNNNNNNNSTVIYNGGHIHKGYNEQTPMTTYTNTTVVPTLGQITPQITNSLPTPQLIAPSQDSVFPLPTLASPLMPEQIALQSLSLSQNTQPPPNVSGEIIPLITAPEMRIVPDNQAVPVNVEASQQLGMQGGNVHLDPNVPQII